LVKYMGWFGGKKKPKRKPPVLEPVGAPAVQASPAAVQAVPVQANLGPSIQAAPAAQQPIVVVAPIGTAADANVMVSAEPVVSSPPVQAPASTGWEKKSEKPLLDIHKRLDHMMDSKGKSLEDRYQDRFGDQLPESVATDSARKDYTEKKTNKPNIVFKPRSKLKLTPKKKTTPKDEEKPVPKKETKDNKVSRLSNKIGSGLKSSGSKTKSALGSAGSAVGRGAGAITSGIGRGAGAVKSGIGRGASSVMGLFGRGSSKEEKPKKGRKTTTDNADYSSMKLPELRAALKKKGLPTSGNKTALIKRLKK
jgi:hypothetical protein